MAVLPTKPTRNIVCACISLVVMTVLWHRIRAPLLQVGGLIASPPQHEDIPGGHAIVKFKNYKPAPLPKGFVKMNGVLVDTRVQAGRDAGIHSPELKTVPNVKSTASEDQKDNSPSTSKTYSGPKVAKVSMLYGSLTDSVYSVAMGTQEDHASLHDYPMHVMHHEIIPSCRGLPVDCNPVDAHGLGGMWNKELYLQSILASELVKPESERVDWVMWQDGDSLTVNPSIPLDIFLPPEDIAGADKVHMLGTKDGEGLNTGVFFLRVSPWSVRFLAACLAVSVTADADDDLGWSYDQSAMAKLLKENEEFKKGIVYQPRRWYNAYNIGDMYPSEQEEGERGPEEDVRGNVLNVHFPGMSGNDRVPVMVEWLRKLEEEDGWDKEVEETDLLVEVDEFWNDFEKTKVKQSVKDLRRARHS